MQAMTDLNHYNIMDDLKLAITGNFKHTNKSIGTLYITTENSLWYNLTVI